MKLKTTVQDGIQGKQVNQPSGGDDKKTTQARETAAAQPKSTALQHQEAARGHAGHTKRNHQKEGNKHGNSKTTATQPKSTASQHQAAAVSAKTVPLSRVGFICSMCIYSRSTKGMQGTINHQKCL